MIMKCKHHIISFLLLFLPFAGIAQNCTPVISAFSSSANVCETATQTLQVTASSPNNSTLTYVWYKNGAVIPSENTNRLVISNFSAADAQAYYVQVSNTCATSTASVTSSVINLTLINKPTVSLSASQENVCVGTSYTLTATAQSNGGGTLTYQWKKAGVNIPGATGASISFTNIQTTDAALYSVDVTNSCGSTSSSNFQLSVNQKPVITAQPASSSLCLGSALSLSATATGSTSAKWQKDDQDLGNTSSSVSVGNVALTDAGRYTYLATNACGTTTSSAAVVEVKQKPTISAVTAPSSVCAGSTVTISSTVVGNGDNVSYKWLLNGTVLTNEIRSSVVINNFQSANAGTYSLEATNTCGTTTSASVSKNVNIQLTTAPSIGSVSDQTACINGSLTVSPVITNISGGTVTYKWFFNGTLLANQQNASLSLTNIQSNQAGSYQLTVNNGCGEYSGSAFNISVQQAPTVRSLSSATQLCSGSTLSLSVDASNTQTYQWTKNDVDINGATTAQYSITATTNDAGTYRVKLSNACGYTITSNAIVVTVNAKPTIVTPPVSASVCVDGSVTFSVVANTNGGGALQYQWKKAGGNISTATSSTLTITGAQSADAGTYSVDVINSCGTTTSADVQLAVNQKPVITAQPASSSLCLGSALSLSATATGSTSAKWQKDDQDLGNTSSSVSVGNVALTDAGRYTYLATNACGTTTSSAAVVEVKQKPTISAVTAPSSVCAGSTVTISSTVVGNGDNVSYKWLLNGTVLTNEIRSSVVINNFQSANAGTYSLEATNTCGTTTSASVSKNVNIQLTTTPSIGVISDQIACINGGLTVTPVVSNLGSGTVTYQWFFNGSLLTGQTNQQLVLNNMQTNQAGSYQFVINNNCAPVYSNNFAISVVQNVVIRSLSSATQICSGEALSLSVDATGVQTFQWTKNNVDIAGATSPQYVVANSTTTNAGEYRVKLSNSCGSNLTSDPISVTIKSKPSIVTPPASNSVCLDGSITSSVVANTNSGGALQYQWKKAGGNILNATNSSFTISSAQNSDAATYAVDITNSCGTTTSADFQLTVNQKPVITTQPVSTSLCVGTALTLSATSTGSTSAKWQKDNQDLGNTTSNVNVANAVLATGGRYTYLATNACGTTTSIAADVTIKQKPTIVSISGPSQVCAGENVTLNSSVTGSGDDLITYAWSRNGVLITNEIGQTLIVNNFQSNNVGTYTLQVSNSCGPTNSSDVNKSIAVQLKSTPTIGAVTDKTACINSSLIVSPVLSNTNIGDFDYQWFFNGSELNAQTTAQLNLTNLRTDQAGSYFLRVNNGCAPVSGPAFNVNVLQSPSITTLTIPSDVCVGTSLAMSVTATHTENYQWTKNNVDISGATSAQYTIPATTNDAGVYRVKLSNACGLALTSNAVNVTVKGVPSIVTPPQNASVCEGSPASASVVANSNGGGDLSYVWSASNIAVPGATASSLSFASVGTNDAKTYSVAVKNSCGTVNGGTFILTVAKKPEVEIGTGIPVNEQALTPTVCLGSSITFFLKKDLSNGATVTYTWYRDDVVLVEQNTPLYSITTSTLANAGVYKLKSTNICGSAISNTITIGVHQAPEIITQPLTQTVCEETNLTLSGAARNKSGTVSKITYSWAFNGAPLGNGTTDQYNFAPVNTSNTGSYTLTARNECGASTSNAALLTVVSKPKADDLTPIADKSICNNPNSTRQLKLNIYTINGAIPEITWSTTDGRIIGATNTPTVTIGSVGKNARYKAIISNACGRYRNDEGFIFDVTNEDALPLVTEFTQPPLTNYCEKESIKLYVKTNSKGYETSVWKRSNGVEVGRSQSGNPPHEFTRNNATVADGGNYYVDITNACGTVTSAAVIEVSVHPTPLVDFEVNTADKQCLSGNSFGFTNRTTNTAGNIEYIWDFGDGSRDRVSVSSSTHSYASTGTFIVKLEGKNQYGCSGSNTEDITVIGSPRIEKQPVGKVVCEGSEYTLSADINNGGSTSLSYQWFLNGSAISGSNSSTYRIPTMNASDEGLYTLKVMNTGCTAEIQTTPVTVSYQALPRANFTVNAQTFNSNDRRFEACINNATFNFTNTTPLVNGVTYLWNVSDGTTSNSQNLVHQFKAAGSYSVTLTATAGGCSSKKSLTDNSGNNLTIVIDNVPIIDKDLVDFIAVKKNTGIVLEVKASSTNNNGRNNSLSYSWYKLPSSAIIFSSDRFNSITNAQISDSGRYYVNVSNGCGTVRSNTIKVRVDDVPIILKQPVSARACVGKPIQVNVEAVSIDGDVPKYQWFYKKDPSETAVIRPGAVDPTLAFPNFTLADVGYYYVKLNNDAGEILSNEIFIGEEYLPQINSIQTTPSLETGICVNTSLQLNASVSTIAGGASYSLTWQQNGVAVAGQTASQYTISSVSNVQNGKITLVATNICGSVTSDVNVKVINVPEFSENPKSVSSCLEGSATFKVKVVEPEVTNPFVYQWLKNGNNYTGSGLASQDQLVLSRIQVADEGLYALQTSNICGIKTSGAGKLTVISTAPQITQQPTSLSNCVGTKQSISLIATSDGSALSYAWYKNGNLMADQLGSKIDFNSLAPGDAGSYRAIVTNACSLSSSTNVSQIVVKEKVSLSESLADRQICSGTELDIDILNNLVGTEPSSTYRWKLNEVEINDATAFTNRIRLGSVTQAQAGKYAITATNSCGSATLPLFTLKILSTPQITKQPLASSVCAGSDFTNSVDLSNPDQIPVSYQWYKDGVALGNANTQQLSLQNISTTNIGLYAVRVSNICGTTPSNNGKLSIVGNPVITQNPLGINECSGTSVSTIILATSDDNILKYAWYKNDVLVSGQTSNKLAFAKLTANDAGTYKAVVTNGCGLSSSSVTSLVFVKEKISIINKIMDAERCNGSDITVDLTNNLNNADGSSIYQWTLNGVDVINSTAASRKLLINSLTPANEGQYSIMATNSCGSADLPVFGLKVISSPAITKQPLTASVCTGSNFTNTVEVANPNQTALSFQWYKDGTLLGNASSQQISLQNIGSGNIGLYSVRVSNLCGVTTSSNARLSLVGNPVITQNPLDINECSGIDAGTTIIAASDDNILKFSWYKNDVLLPSQTSNKLSFAKLSATDAGSYKAVVTNSCNLSVNSSLVRVLVREKIDVINKIQDAERCVGTDFSIDVTNNLKNADVDATYQWKLNGVDFVNTSATSKRLVIGTLSPVHTGQYSLTASNSCGAANISMFKLAVVSLPVISTHPISSEICEEASWTTRVALANPNQSAATYQWYKDEVALVNGTSSEFILNNLTFSNQGIYYVKVSSVCGSVISDKVGLAIKPRPQLGINLVSTPPVQCLENNRFEFGANVRIADNTPVDLTWDFGDGVYSKRVSDGHSYKFADNFKVYLYGKSQNGCLDTALQTVTVNTKPAILNDLASQAVCKDAQLNYTIDVKQLPNENVSYQWYFNQALLIKETTKSLTVNRFTEANKGFYSVRISNSCGSSYSNEVKADLAERPLLLSTLPIDKKVCEGDEIVLKPGVFSLMPVTYQWFKNNLPMPDKELDSLLIRGFNQNDVARYAVRVENICGVTLSPNGNLIMKNLPFTPQGVYTDTLCFAQDKLLKVDPIRNNDDTLRITWYRDKTLLQSGISNQLALTNFNIYQTGLYKVILSNSCGDVDVPVVSLAVNKIKTGFRLDTLDACSGKLKIDLTDTSKGFFPIAKQYWDIPEIRAVLPGRINTSYQFTTPGRYMVRHSVVDERGCISDTVFTTTVNYEKPTAVFSIADNCLASPSLAKDSSFVGLGSSKLVRYMWDFGDTIITRSRAVVPSYTYQTPGLKRLKLTVMSDSSCVVDTLVKTFMVYGKPVASFVSQDSCQGFPVYFTNRSSTAFLPDSVTRFSWSFDDGNTSTVKDPQHIFKQYGSHRVRLIAYSANCPDLTDDTVVNLSIKSPRANLVYPRIQGVKGVPGQLNAASGGRSYNWVPFTGLSDSRIKSPVYKLSDSKVMYTITIVDSAGCVYKDQQEVWAFEKPDIYIATGFSPNNDGINDSYAPEYIQIKYLEYFRIADKNNRQIFITNDMKVRWDGTHQGSQLPPDPYVVTVAGVDINGNRITKQGIVILVR